MRDKSYQRGGVAALPGQGAWPSLNEGLDMQPPRKPNSKHSRRQPPLSAEGDAAQPPLEEDTSLSRSEEQAIVPTAKLAAKQAADAPGADAAEPLGKSVISALQEFVQDSKTFRMPIKQSVLQWSFEEHAAKQPGTEFRATVVFFLEGVPHHVAGEWRASKSLAKRDAAERSLELFVSQWGLQMLQEDPRESLQICQNEAEVDVLFNFCRHFPACCQVPPQLSTSWEGDACKGVAQISFFGVPHTFAGSPCQDEEAARGDVARRVLWYLQCPGFDDEFQVDMDAALSACSQDTSAPPAQWLPDDVP